MTGREIAPGGRAVASLSDNARALAAASIAPKRIQPRPVAP